MTTPRVWLITGTSSGFGKSVAEFVLSKGDIVVATLRKPEALRELSETYSKDRLLVLKVDVTNPSDIEHAFARTKEVFGRLDVVFNNAGYAVVGDAETTPVDVAQAMFNVNFWGAINVSRAAVKFFREVNEPGRGGVLLQNSSIVAVDSVAGLTFYSASKHAFDGFSEGLAKELLPQWNIKICIIQPGSFDTNGFASATVLPENPVYNDEESALARFRKRLSTGSMIGGGDPADFSPAIYSVVEGGDMPLHLLIGRDAVDVGKAKVASLGQEIAASIPL